MIDPLHRKRVHRRQKIKQEQTKQTVGWFLVALCVIMWSLVALIIFFVEPALVRDVLLPGLYLPLFIVLSLALAVTLFLFTHHWKRSLIYCLAMIILLYLQVLDLGSWISTLLILALLVLVEFVFLEPALLTKDRQESVIESKP